MPEKPAQYSYTILPTFNHSSSISLCLCFTDSALQTVQLRFIEWIDKITDKAETDQIAERMAEVSYTFYVAALGRWASAHTMRGTVAGQMMARQNSRILTYMDSYRLTSMARPRLQDGQETRLYEVLEELGDGPHTLDQIVSQCEYRRYGSLLKTEPSIRSSVLWHLRKWTKRGIVIQSSN